MNPSNPATLPPPEKPKSKTRWGCWLVSVLVLLPLAGGAAYTWAAMNFSYSEGERAGYIQKISKRGWLCKTWEGELAISNVPGSAPQIFAFSVRDDRIAKDLEDAAGKRVSLAYEQHKGIPTNCLAETEYWVKGVRVLPGN